MRTYQDLLKIGNDERKRKDFVRALIQEQQTSDEYQIAKDAYDYFCHKNVTIVNYQKLLYKVTGEVVPDNYSANFKVACRHFYRFLTQEVSYLLGNGISWNEDATEGKLGKGSKSIDRQTISAAEKALWGRVAFGFYDQDHVEVFDALEFVPLFDEISGALMAGVRYWQIDKSKPLIATLYEIDGFTKYAYNTKEDLDEPKRTYKRMKAVSEADGVEYYGGQNYPTFPIVPFWGNEQHQSEIVGMREQIDCYDLIKSGFANTVDEASIVYWTLKNAGGMDDVDLSLFVDRMKKVHAVSVDDEVVPESHQMDAPYASREALLDRLERDMYRDAMAVDTQRITGGAVTATEIDAAYEDLDKKCDKFEMMVLDWLNGIMAVAGIEDEPTFTRSKVVNRSESITTILAAAQYLPQEYVTTKILEILGDADKVDEVLKQMDEDDMSRFTGGNEPPTGENEPIEE